MMSPFKWTLSGCTFSWCYLFVKNENWKFGPNLPLSAFDIERVKYAKYYVNTSPTMLYYIFLVKAKVIISWCFSLTKVLLITIVATCNCILLISKTSETRHWGLRINYRKRKRKEGEEDIETLKVENSYLMLQNFITETFAEYLLLIYSRPC